MGTNDESTRELGVKFNKFILDLSHESSKIQGIDSQRKSTIDQLNEGQDLLHVALELTNDGLWDWNLKANTFYFSNQWKEMLGFKEHEIGNNPEEWFDRIHPKDLKNVLDLLKDYLLGKSGLFCSEYHLRCKDKSYIHVLCKGKIVEHDDSGHPSRMIGIQRIITRRKITEDKEENQEGRMVHDEREVKHWNILENLNDVIFEVDSHGIISFISSSVEKTLEYSAAEVIGRNFVDFVGHNGQFLLNRLIEIREKTELTNEYKIFTKSGNSIWVKISTRAKFSDGVFSGATGTIINITESKRVEEKLEKLNRLYLVLIHASQALVHTKDKAQLMQQVCHIAVEYGKFHMAWIGLIDDKSGIVKPFVAEGNESGYLTVIPAISVANIPSGQGPTGTAIRNGQYYVCADIEADPGIGPWREEALSRGYRSSIALPLKQSGKIIGAFSLYSSIPDFFDDEEIRLLFEFVNEISFAFDVIETENQRDKAEEQLRKLYLAVEQSPASIVITDTDGNIEYANPKAIISTGYNIDELIGINPRVLKSGETPDLEYQKLWEDITSGREWHGIFHNKRKSGELYWESSTISPIKDHQGKITHFLAVKNDITEQKLAEQELRKFRTIADQANYGSAIASLEGKLLYINEAFAGMHGYDADEVIGKSLTIFHNHDQLPKIQELLQELRITGSFSAREVWHLRKDGSIFPTLMNASIVFDEANIPLFLSATAIDITELNQKEEALIRSEEELNYAQRLANLGSWEHNLLTGKLLGSKNYHSMLGLDPNDFSADLYGYFLSIVHPDDLKIIDFLQTHRYSPGEMQVVELRIKIPGQGIRWIQNNVVPVFEYNRLVGLKGVNIDITEKKKILEDLIKAKEQAEESDKLKTSFLNNISHEIRTPFNGILGFLSMLQFDDLTSDERDEYIGLINQSADRLMNTINAIVDLSQIQSGLIKPVLTKIDIESIISEQISRFKPEAVNKGLLFDVISQHDSSGLKFSTDHKILGAILFHLIGNALKFTKSGSVELFIAGNDLELQFCVKDTGIGISPYKQKMIFNSFIQADHSATRKFEGSGIGLTIAKAYVEILNGKMWLESEENIGSAFYFTIPNSYKKNIPKERPINVQEEMYEQRIRDLKILVAEDDDGSSLFISILVKPISREVLRARSGLEAVEICRNNQDIDVVLMDIRMPVMDGYEATRQIRKFNPEVVIIAQTAFALSGDFEKTIDAGCTDYISKPIQKDKLIALIEKYLARNKSR